ncbi:alpha/beta hydrolase [Sphingosinicella sp. LHD-64]|uniref:alpha/beta hydrolase n=1 Tax=Sphingosinicella sp. LHD-64 TaxID=3072139 RepID=UPI00280C7B8A|nr:alpha/beta hydrolase [Sphingosinicella sp. LHD-64]MDQ8756270.1 alpha/beta hydrolase [Sphingosinicella sp. LHD-64]
MLLALLAALLLPTAAQAETGAETIRLWPGDPPGHGRPAGPERVGGEGSGQGAYTNISTPRMEVYRPERPTGAAVLVIGGGGYFRIQIDSAARPIARWLQGQGINAIVLFYRLPGDGWNADAPFQDGQRAMRLLRAHAARLGIDPDRVGVLGSSAGGHLAGILATRGDHDFYARVDAVDAQPARPDFAGLIYPVISLRAPLDTTRTARHLAGLPNAVSDYSVEAHVDAATPPIFLAHAADDPTADVGHSLALFAAMRAANRPVALHVFDRGGHSWGMGAPGSQVAAWPSLFETWLRSHQFPAPQATPAGTPDS